MRLQHLVYGFVVLETSRPVAATQCNSPSRDSEVDDWVFRVIGKDIIRVGLPISPGQRRNLSAIVLEQLYIMSSGRAHDMSGMCGISLRLTTYSTVDVPVGVIDYCM
jgi:hypothetical protein